MQVDINYLHQAVCYIFTHHLRANLIFNNITFFPLIPAGIPKPSDGEI